MTTETSKPSAEKLESVVGEIVSLGSLWAKYGLTVGQQLLETTSRTLATTAKLLGETARNFEQPAKPSTQQ
jgi:hypothetical protein